MARTPLQTVVRKLRALVAREQLATASDADLLERFAHGRDDAAFALLVERHGGLVWRVCRQILHHDQDAEDCYQAAFLTLAQHASSIRHGQTIACWLYRVSIRVARRAAVDRAKRHHHERVRPCPPCRQDGSDLSWRELQKVLHDELARLPEKYRAPFVLCCVDGNSKLDAAQQLGWKVGTVSSRLAHAREVMRRRLTHRGIALSAALCAIDLLLPCNRAPAALAQATARAAAWLRAGRDAKEFVSSAVITLMQGADKIMLFGQPKTTLGIVVALSLIGTGTWAVARQGAAVELPARKATADSVPAAIAKAHFDATAPAQPPQSPPGKPWIGFASRETNAGPELSILYKDGTRQTYEAAADTVLLSYLPDQPLGAHESLSVDLADSNRVLLQFDWPRSARIEKAELILSRSQNRHPYPHQPMLLAFHTVTEAWSESTTTWNRQPAFERKPALTAQIDPSAKEYRIDVTALVQEPMRAPRYGWLLRTPAPLAAEATKADGGRPAGWSCLGTEYAYTLDSTVRHGGTYSCRIESGGARPSGFAMLSQTIRADDYRGQRIRFSGSVKTEHLSGMATLWMRIDKDGELLAIDTTIWQAVRGTTHWQHPRIVLDVPAESKTIRFAVLVEGEGKAWVDDLKLEMVDRSVPVTNPSVRVEASDDNSALPLQPRNLDFEEKGKP
jgi:RNA polymerase sigma factor (sigma-70 family)